MGLALRPAERGLLLLLLLLLLLVVVVPEGLPVSLGGPAAGSDGGGGGGGTGVHVHHVHQEGRHLLAHAFQTSCNVNVMRTEKRNFGVD